MAIALRIQSLAFGGRGVARLPDGRVVFVPFTAVGDEIDAEIVHERRNFVEARVCELRTPGPGRREPVCPYYERCGGCQYQHLEYDVQLAAKSAQLMDTLRRIGRFDDLPEATVVASAAEFGYRNKITLERVRNSQPAVFGYFELDNRTVLPVERCPLVDERINEYLASFRSNIADGSLRVARPVRRMTVRQPATGTAVHYFDRGSRRARMLTERIGDREVVVPLNSFWQVNPGIAPLLIDTVRTWLADGPDACLIDTYGGVGLFSLALGPMFEQSVLIESDEGALRAAGRNCEAWATPECSILPGPAESLLPLCLAKLGETRRQRTAVVLDPPRSGCGAAALTALAETPVPRIVYVSCNAATLARDLRKLCDAHPYRIADIAMLDMFPQTAHFEVAALLVSA